MQKLDIFAEAGAVHGVKYILTSSRSKFTRIFWTFSLLLSICGFFYYLYPAWTKLMFEPEILIKTHTKKITEFPWPAITVCPNVFGNSDLVSLQKLSNVMKMRGKLTQQECRLFYANFMWCKPPRNLKIFNHCKVEDFDDLNIIEDILKSSVDLRQAVHSFTSYSYRVNVFSGNGPCITFNLLSFSQIFNPQNIHDDYKQFQKILADGVEDNSMWSSEKGLNLANGSEIRAINKLSMTFFLRLSPIDVANTCAGLQTFKIFVHKPNEIVTTEHESIFVNFNESKLFRLTLKSKRSDDALQGFPTKSRKCIFENENPLKFFKSYSKNHCELECRSNAFVKSCGCVHYALPRDKDTKVCTADVIYRCLNETKKVECNCYELCNDLGFDLTSEHQNIDQEFYEFHKKSSDWVLSILTFTFDINVEEVEHYLAYKTQNFISDFGGLLGLFMGCSLLSLVEIFYFIFLGFHKIIQKFFEKSENPKIIQVKPAASLMTPLDHILITLNSLTKTVEQKVKNDEVKFLKIDKKFAAFEKEFEEIRSKIEKIEGSY